MLKRFFPKEPNFFKSLAEIADLAMKSAEHFEGMINNPAAFEKNAMAIKEIERHADTLVRHSIETIAQTFITPIEREHLHSLYILSDEVIDLIYATSERFTIYKLNEVSLPTQNMIRMTKSCVLQFQGMLHNLDEMAEPEQLKEFINGIDQLENEIDKTMRISMAELYDSDLGLARIMKERDIILMIERVSDEIQKVANLIEAILIDQA